MEKKNSTVFVPRSRHACQILFPFSSLLRLSLHSLSSLIPLSSKGIDNIRFDRYIRYIGIIRRIFIISTSTRYWRKVLENRRKQSY